MQYSKPPLLISQQINLLKSRGLIIDDLARAESYLSNVSYYRLSGYLYPFRNRETDQYTEGLNFETIIDLYHFDRELRMLVFDATESLEVAFRTQLIYHPSITGNAFWFQDESNFHDKFQMQEQLDKLGEEIRRSSEIFLDHFRTKYAEEPMPPAWMAFEVISLSLLSKIYHNVNDSLPAKKQIAAHFGINDTHIFQSWIRSITYVRNLCAHHSRLWNRTLTNKPVIYRKPPQMWLRHVPQNDKIYYFLCCITYMLRAVNPNTFFIDRLKALLSKHPNIQLASMGFPDNWKEEQFWKNDKRG